MHLLKRQPDGNTLHQHLLAAAEATGRPEPALLKRVPRAASALWEAFCELAASRPAGMAPAAIPGTEIEAWQRLSGVQLSGWEVDTLRAMDRAALAAMSEAKGAAV